MESTKMQLLYWQQSDHDVCFRIGNPNLSWAQCLNYNVGVDATVWNGLLGVNLTYSIIQSMINQIATVTGAHTFKRWILFQFCQCEQD